MRKQKTKTIKKQTRTGIPAIEEKSLISTFLQNNTTKAILGGLTLGLLQMLIFSIISYAKTTNYENKTRIITPITAKVTTLDLSRKKILGTNAAFCSNDQAKSKPYVYTIRTGDSLAKIGKIFCNSPRAYLHLIEINNFSDNYRLSPGDQITISCE